MAYYYHVTHIFKHVISLSFVHLSSLPGMSISSKDSISDIYKQLSVEDNGEGEG